MALGALGAALTALMFGALALHVPGADNVGSLARTNIFVGVLALGMVAYLLAVRLVLRHTLPRQALWIVLLVAAVMRAGIIPAPPFLSSDIYRYVWDGQVQNAGINPYRYIPADPALTKLRDKAIFPLINRADYARTIYPPAAQIVFAVTGFFSRSVLGMKLAMLGFELLAMVCALRLLALARLPPERLLVYAWNPLVLWSFAGNGHVDAIAIGLLALALLLRARHHHGVAGLTLAGAVLVKFLPVVVAPAFLRGGTFWRPALAGSALIVALYALYASAGAHVLGFLGGYGTEEGMADGSGIWLLAGLSHLFPLPTAAPAIYAACVAAGFAVLALRIMRGREPLPDTLLLCRDVAVLAACATVAISPHYPWYFAWLALPAVVAPIPAVIWLSVSPVLLYLDPFHERFFWPCLVYLPAVALSLVGLWRRHACPALPAAMKGSS